VEISGGWEAAQNKIDEMVKIARAYQQPSGALSVNYFARPADSPDLSKHLGATGHTLEFLCFALDDEQLREPWVTRAVVYLCDLFRRTRSIDLECGALYHAAHGLSLYRDRRFGRRVFCPPKTAAEEAAPKDAGPNDQVTDAGQAG
jgi:hypothetical protein